MVSETPPWPPPSSTSIALVLSASKISKFNHFSSPARQPWSLPSRLLPGCRPQPPPHGSHRGCLKIINQIMFPSLSHPSWLPIPLRIKPTFSLWLTEPHVIWPQPIPLACLLLPCSLSCSCASLLHVRPAPKPFPAPGPHESSVLSGMLILHINMIPFSPTSSLT